MPTFFGKDQLIEKISYNYYGVCAYDFLISLWRNKEYNKGKFRHYKLYSRKFYNRKR